MRTLGLGQSTAQWPCLLHFGQGDLGGGLDLLPAFPCCNDFSWWDCEGRPLWPLVPAEEETCLAAKAALWPDCCAFLYVVM